MIKGKDVYFLCYKDFKPILWENIKKNIKKNKEDVVYSDNLHELIRKIKPSYFRKDAFLKEQLVVKMDTDGNIIMIDDDDLLEAVFEISEEMGEDLPNINFDINKLLKELGDLMGKYKKAELITINEHHIIGFDLIKNKKISIKGYGSHYPEIKIARMCFESSENLSFCYLKINTGQQIEGEDVYEIYSFLLEGMPHKKFFKINWRYSTARTVLETMTIDSKPLKHDIYCGIDGEKICGFDLI